MTVPLCLLLKGLLGKKPCSSPHIPALLAARDSCHIQAKTLLPDAKTDLDLGHPHPGLQSPKETLPSE